MRFVAALLVTSLAFIDPSVGDAQSAPTPDLRPVVQIGAVLPLSGGLAHMGSAYRNAMNLAVEELTTATKFQYKLIFEDDQGQSKNAVTGARKLLAVDNVQALITLWSNPGKAVGPVAAAAKVPHFACAWDKSVTEAATTFNLSATPDYFMGEYLAALEKRGVKQLSIIELNEAGSVAHDILEKLAKDSQVKIVKRQRFNPGDRDFRSLLTAVRATPADTLYINAGSPELEMIVRQSKEMQLGLPITTIGCIDFTTDLKLFEGSWYMTMTWPKPDFVARYKARFKSEIVYQLGNYYDMVGVLIAAFEDGARDGQPSVEAALQQLAELQSYDGVLGALKVDSDRSFQSAPTYFEVRDGVRQRVGG